MKKETLGMVDVTRKELDLIIHCLSCKGAIKMVHLKGGQLRETKASKEYRQSIQSLAHRLDKGWYKPVSHNFPVG